MNVITAAALAPLTSAESTAVSAALAKNCFLYEKWGIGVVRKGALVTQMIKYLITVLEVPHLEKRLRAKEIMKRHWGASTSYLRICVFAPHIFTKVRC